MKAVVKIPIKHYQPLFNEGDKVEIIPGMETDGEGIWNCPCGKLVYCKSDDGRCGYMPVSNLQITGTDTTTRDEDYFLKIRDKLAAELFVKMFKADKYVSDSDGDYFSSRAVGHANKLVNKLMERDLKW